MSRLCSVEFGRAAPYQGEHYIQLGLSATTQDTSPFSVSRGVITSIYYNNEEEGPHAFILDIIGPEALSCVDRFKAVLDNGTTAPDIDDSILR